MKTSVKNVTLADVARSAGVAPMTVSRFLNKHPNISEKTAKKVKAAIKKLNYAPNLAARVLAGQTSRAIGVVVPNLTDPFYAELVHHVQSSARNRGVLVWIGASESNTESEAALIERMNQQGVDGIIMVPAPGKNNFDPADLRVPLVVMDRPLLQGATDMVLIDNRKAAYEAVQHLIAHERKQIFCVSTYTPHDYTNKQRIAGYEDAVNDRGLKSNVLSDLQNTELVLKALKKILASKQKPAIFTTHSVATMQVLSLLADLGATVPEDVALVGFDDLPMASMFRPAPTVVRQPVEMIAQHATRLLFEHIDEKADQQHSPLSLTLTASLVIRESCGCTLPTPVTALSQSNS